MSTKSTGEATNPVALRTWKMAVVGLLAVLAIVLAGGGWYLQRVQRINNTVQVQDKVPVRLKGDDGSTLTVEFINDKGTGARIKKTEVKDKNGHVDTTFEGVLP
jgi:hypothetical protein